MAETVRDAFEEWAHADHRRLEPNEYEADDRTPGNNHYYDDDTTNQAYIGWCAAWNRRATDPAVAELVEGLKQLVEHTDAMEAHNYNYHALAEHGVPRQSKPLSDAIALLAKHAAKYAAKP